MQRNAFVGTLLTVLLAGVVIGVSSLQAARQAQEVSLTGCLKAGEKDGDFLLVIDEKEKHHVQAGEGVELAPHVNHRVQITGTIEKNETNSVLKATALKMVADSCES
jgi:nicotinamidase-related amidase